VNKKIETAVTAVCGTIVNEIAVAIARFMHKVAMRHVEVSRIMFIFLIFAHLSQRVVIDTEERNRD